MSSESVADEIGATYVHLDVVNESEWISIVELIASQGQGLHFVMNAGIAVNGNLETETIEGFMQPSTSTCSVYSWDAKSARH